MLKNLLLTILLFSGFNAFSQAHFEGIVTYEMQLADRNSADVSDETGGSDHLIPKEFKLYINGNRTRLEINAGQSVVTVISSAADSTYTLMQIMGRKIALRTDTVQITAMQDRLSGFRMVNLEGKRKILGYDCRKALMIHEASGDSAEVWYTRELPPMKVASGEFLPRMDDYFPMEVTSRKDGIELTMRLREIQLVQVDKRFFELPSGYTIVDQDEIQKGLQLLSTP